MGKEAVEVDLFSKKENRFYYLFGDLSEYFHLQREGKDGVKALILLSCVLGLAFCSTSSAVIIPDFQVNPQDTAFIAQWTTDIAFQPNGNLVVVWEDRGKDHNNRQIYFQRCDSLGNLIGLTVQVSDTTTGFYNQECRIAGDSSGNFAICYSSAKFSGVDSTSGENIYLWDIWVRLYDANGVALTPLIKADVDRPDPVINPGTYGEDDPHIAMDKTGKFVVVWHEEASFEVVGQKTFCQFFDSEGNRVGNNIWVSNPDSSEFPISWWYSHYPRVGITDNGYVLICWEGLITYDQHSRPLARLYSLDGTSLRKVFTLLDLNDPRWVFGSKPDVDNTPNNEFVVTINSNDKYPTYPNNAVLVARFDTLGNPLNTLLVVIDTADIGDIFWRPRVAAGQEGYIVSWSDARISKDDRNLMAQRFDYNDQPIGKNYRINSINGSLRQVHQFYDFDISPQGEVGFSWSDFRNFIPYNYDVYAKVLDFNDIGFYMSGDFNLDGKANLEDLISLVNYVFKGGVIPLPLYVADVTGDCKVNLADIIYLVNYVFKGGAAPKQGCA